MPSTSTLQSYACYTTLVALATCITSSACVCYDDTIISVYCKLPVGEDNSNANDSALHSTAATAAVAAADTGWLNDVAHSSSAALHTQVQVLPTCSSVQVCFSAAHCVYYLSVCAS
jgi:hypothetical protein